MVKYLIFTEKPEGNPEISKGNYVSPTACQEGFFVDGKDKEVVDAYGWTGYTEAEVITPLTPVGP